MAIKTWVFLLQHIDDLTWHPLTPGATFFPGDYRLSVQSPQANSSMEIRLLSQTPQGNQTVKCHSDCSDGNGNLMILPPWHLSPGAWQIHCRPDIFGALLGEEWQEVLNFVVAELVEDKNKDSEPAELLPPQLSLTPNNTSKRHALLSSLLEDLPAALELDVAPLPLGHGQTAEPPLTELRDFEQSLGQPLVLPPLDTQLQAPEEALEPVPQYIERVEEPEEAIIKETVSSEQWGDWEPPAETSSLSVPPEDKTPAPTKPAPSSRLVTYVLQIDDTEKNQRFTVDITLWEDLSRPPHFLDLPQTALPSRRSYYLQPRPNQILPPKLQPRSDRVTRRLKFEKIKLL